MREIDSFSDGPAVYNVRVEGHIPIGWSDRLLAVNIMTADSDRIKMSIIVGRLPDQALLAGVMNTLCEQRIVVLSVECLDKG